MAASGEREPNDFLSLFRGPGIKILLGAGAGYLAGRLFACGECARQLKLAELNSVPTIPISSLKYHEIPKEGELVVIEDGEVYPLSSVPDADYRNNEPPRYDESGAELVVSKTRTWTNEPQEFKDVFNGGSSVDVYRVPFALVEGKMFGRGSFVVVKNVDTDHLPLEQKETKKTPFEPPLKLTKKVIIEKGKSKRKMSSTIEVYKMSKQSVLRMGTRMESVFGRLSMRNGKAEIEPCPNFPKECFTMRRDEIKRMVSGEVNGDEILGAGLGLLSFGLLFSGLYSYART